MHLLKMNVPFIWDDQAKKSFDELKHELTNSLVLHPLDYMRYYILYLVASISTIIMILVKENDNNKEHMVYYISKSLAGPKFHYSHVEKLALTKFISIKRFFHYILL
jgi:hypothetical protein